LAIPIRTITLQQRLAQLVGRRIQIEAENLSLEPGLLQRVFRRSFIRVTGELFVPLTLNRIIVFNVPLASRTAKVSVTTTFGGSRTNVPLVAVGADFIELQGQGASRQRQRILIPINKVIRISGLSLQRN
jgi:hypothetical protein